MNLKSRCNVCEVKDDETMVCSECDCRDCMHKNSIVTCTYNGVICYKTKEENNKYTIHIKNTDVYDHFAIKDKQELLDILNKEYKEADVEVFNWVPVKLEVKKKTVNTYKF